MTRSLQIVILALAAIPAMAQEVPPPQELPQTPPQVKRTAPVQHNGRIIGTIFCADTHRPARGAMVTLTSLPSADGKQQGGGGPSTFARVASDGSYSIEHVAPGEYGVIAMLPGYLSPMDQMTADEMGGGFEAKIRPYLKDGTVIVRGQETARFDFSLQRGAAVSGRILYSDGAPASQISIEVQDINAKPPSAKTPQNGMNFGMLMRTLFLHQSQGTDDQGRFRISGLSSGTYRVAAIQASDLSMGDGADDGMSFLIGMPANPKELHIYSGDTIHKESAKTYELRAGDEISGVDITIPLDAFHRVEGRLTAVDGRNINMAGLTLTDADDDSLAFRATVQRDGTFRFRDVPAGTYTLAASNAKIVKVPDDFPEGAPLRDGTMQPTSVFADGSTSVIVKDVDVSDVGLTLTEIPLPSDAEKPGAD
jgi:hypothetical protein